MAYIAETDGEINLVDIWKAVKKHYQPIIGVSFAAALIVGIVTFFWIPKQYQSDVAFYIHEKSSSGILSAFGSQLGALGSFLPSVGGGANADLCRDIVLARQFLKRVLKAEGQPHQQEDVKRFKEKITVKNEKSGVVSIAVLAKSPKLAYRLAKRISKEYQQVLENEIYQNNSSNRVFIEEQLAKSEARLERAEQQLLNYQQQNGVLMLPEEVAKAIEYFAELEKARLEVRIGLDGARRRLHEADTMLAQNGGGLKESIRAAINPVLQQYKLKLSEVEVQLARARETLTDRHPTVKSLLAQRAELISKMQQEEANITSPEVAGDYLKGLVEVAGLEARHESLTKIYNQKKAQLDRLPEQLLQYGRLVREQKVAEQIYTLLVSQLEQARIAESRENNVEIQIIDAPVIPDKKHSPSTVINILLTGIITVFLGIGWAVFKERELVFGSADIEAGA
ncbi:MAG TPA: GNVR domain-containing protein [Bacillota bacterium]